MEGEDGKEGEEKQEDKEKKGEGEKEENVAAAGGIAKSTSSFFSSLGMYIFLILYALVKYLSTHLFL